MLDQVPSVPVSELKEILDRGGMPQSARLAGLGLLRRLSGPVRVAILGLPGSGKTSLVNMLVGAPLIPDDPAIPTLHLSYGKPPRLTATLTDGELTAIADLSFKRLAGLSAQSAQIDIPAPLLQHFSLSDYVLPTDPPAQHEVLEQALRRSDIVLWCSEGYSQQDQALWSGVPDVVKDHAYLVLTKADKAAATGSLGQLMQVVGPVASQDFHSVFPLAALQGLAACKGGKPADMEKWTNSGAATLVRSLRDHAASGRREDIDFADVFISRYGAKPSGRAAAVAPALAQPAPLPHRVALPPDAAEHCARAVTHLIGSAGQFAPLIRIGDDEAQSTILSQCVRVVEELADLVAPLENSNDNSVVDDINEAVEMITLLQLEGGAGPASDALALLAQLKDELEDQLAA